MPIDTFLEAALHYAGRGWPVFPVSRSKLPFKGSHGHLDATADPQTLESLWAAHPSANVALATGRLVVFDCDGAEGAASFQALGPSPETLVARTPRGGLHFYYHSDTALRCHNAPRRYKGGPGLDIKAHGGFVLLPPSRDRMGGAYTWARHVPIAALPAHLLTYAQAAGAQRAALPQLAVPQHLQARAQRDLAGAGLAGMGLDWSPHEEARIRSALKCIGETCGYDAFLKICASLHGLNWVRSDGSDIGFEILNEWCQGFSERYSLDGLEYKWRSFRPDYRGARATIGTLFYLAGEAGWDGTVKAESEVLQHVQRNADFNAWPPVLPVTEPEAFSIEGQLTPLENGQAPNRNADPACAGTGRAAPAAPVAANPPAMLNGHSLALPAALALVFPDTDRGGRPRATLMNACAAIRALGIACRKNIFHDRLEIEGHPTQRWQQQVSDEAIIAIRSKIRHEFDFDPGTLNTNDGVIVTALENYYHPIRDYLEGLAWDRRPRIDRWLVDYMSAEDTPLTREFGRLMLLAAVRRVREPGAKFDEILVLEGPEGASKSTAIRLLAGEGNFSDQPILTLSDRAQQEALRGVWLYEIADLTGISRADVDKVKAFASRTVDRARPAYGRHRLDLPRQCVFFGTTNNERYLQSQTGNRRWWPVQVGKIKLAELHRDRDQLWAEAVARELHGSIRLAEKFWPEAGKLQTARLEQDPWFELIGRIEPNGKNTFPAPDGTRLEIRISTLDLFTLVLQLPAHMLHVAHSKRLAFVMKQHGWEGPKVFREGSKVVRGYTKKLSYSN